VWIIQELGIASTGDAMSSGFLASDDKVAEPESGSVHYMQTNGEESLWISSLEVKSLWGFLWVDCFKTEGNGASFSYPRVVENVDNYLKMSNVEQS
jgi:hypothetical protein